MMSSVAIFSFYMAKFTVLVEDILPVFFEAVACFLRVYNASMRVENAKMEMVEYVAG